MQLRHERRRRLFADDTASAASAKTIPLPVGADHKADRPANAYTEAAQAAGERAVSSLVPARLLTIALAVSACLLLVGGCLALHLGYPTMIALLPADDVAFLRIDAPGSIGRWLASTLLAVCGALALFIFSLRRHRIDDYHARYRMWIWVFIVCILASLAETTGIGQLARAACRRLAESTGVRNNVLWSATFASLAGAIGLRLFFEIRRSRGAVAALVACVLGFLTVVAANTHWPEEWSAAGQPILARGVWLASYVLVLAMLLLYARYIQLEVSGAVAAPVKRRKPKKRKKQTPSPDAAEPVAKPKLHVQTDLDPVETPSSAKPETRPQPTAAGNEDDNPRTDAEVDPPHKSKKHLSKAERRRLRREARATRMAS